MTITIELPNELHRQAEAYAASKNQNLETLFVSFLQDSLADEMEKQAEVLSDGRTWEDVRTKIMTERKELWQRLAKL